SYTDSTRLSIVDLFVFGDDFLLTKKDLDDPDALFQVENIEGYMAEASVHLNDFRNAIHTRDFSFNTTEKKAEISQIRIQNKLEPYAYAGEFRYETDWIELEEGNLQVEGLDFFNYFQHGAIYAEKLKIADMRIVIFRDKWKHDDMERRPAMLPERLRRMPIP